MFKQATLLAACLFLATQLLATHNYSGEISFQKTGGLGVVAIVTTYTKASSVNADRDTLTLAWGDGTTQQIVRKNGSGNGELISNDIKKNIYVGSHTYATEGIYWISMTDPNRSGQIINLNPPASDNVPFHLEAMIRLLPDAAASVYSPILLEYPIDEGLLGQTFQHAPNAFDPDGDSLVYSLSVPMQGIGEPVPNYSFPDEILPGPDNQISFNSATGNFIWEKPQVAGAYCVAITIRAYRNGILMEEVRRDMLFFISQGANLNQAPTLVLSPNVPETEIVEVHVGQTFEVQVSAEDPNSSQNFTLSASSGLMTDFFQNKATFSTASDPAVFSWTVTSEHIRDQPYQVAFKVKDDFQNEGLARFRLMRFHVNALSGVRGPSIETAGLHLFPDPTPGRFSVELPENVQPGAIFRIISLTGQFFREESVQVGVPTQQIQTDDLPSGLYFLQMVATGKLLAVQRFVKD